MKNNLRHVPAALEHTGRLSELLDGFCRHLYGLYRVPSDQHDALIRRFYVDLIDAVAVEPEIDLTPGPIEFVRTRPAEPRGLVGMAFVERNQPPLSSYRRMGLVTARVTGGATDVSVEDFHLVARLRVVASLSSESADVALARCESTLERFYEHPQRHWFSTVDELKDYLNARAKQDAAR